MKHLESLESLKVAKRSPTSGIPHEKRENLQVPARVWDLEGGAVCSKNSTFFEAAILLYKDRDASVSVKRLYSVTGTQPVGVGHEYALTEFLRASSLSITGSKLYSKIS